VKKAVLVFLLLAIVVHAPWRLAGLVVETLVMHTGPTRMAHGTDKYWDVMALKSRLVDLGWEVKYEKKLIVFPGTPVYGLTIPDEHTIYVNADLSWNARYAVLAHEGGHVLQRGWYNQAEGDAFAESVAALVAHDGLREHARYLSSLKMSAVWIMVIDWRAIYRAADVLLEDL
jgi:hypothetical protein